MGGFAVKWPRIVFFILLPFAVYSLWDYVETKRIASRIDAIERRKEPLIVQGPFPTGEARQAERLYRAAAALVVSPGVGSIADRNALSKAAPNDPWTPQGLALARAPVAANREAIDLVDRAARLSFVGFLPGTSYNYFAGDLLTLRIVLERRAAVALHEGKGEEALISFYSEARLARALDSMTVLRSFFAPIPRFAGLSAAVAAAPRSSVREALGPALADLDAGARLRPALLLSRAKTLTASSLGPRRHAANPIVAHMIVTELDTYEAQLDAAGKPWPQRIHAVNAVAQWPETYPFPNGGRILRDFTKLTVDQVRRIRCARLIVSTRPLDLIDPLTGQRLEPSQCHL